MRSIAEIEKAITATRQRIDADQSQPITRQNFDLQDELGRALAELYDEKKAASAAEAREIAGLPAEKSKTPASRPDGNLRMPARITPGLKAGEKRAECDLASVVAGCRQPSEEDKAATQKIIDAFGYQFLQKREDAIQTWIGDFVADGMNEAVAFSRGQYGAFVLAITHIELMQRASAVLARKRMDSLQARIEELEARGEFVDRGTWKQGLVASKGHAVTFDGSLWLCQSATMDRPGTSAAWRLAVKRGRDGKDAR